MAGGRTDWTGRRYSRLVVIGRSVRRASDGHVLWHVRCDCGVEKEVAGAEMKKGKTMSCGCWQRESSRARRGLRHHAWKGGRLQDGRGYIRLSGVMMPGEAGPRKYVKEHIYVMAWHLGRTLFRHESVHHKNGRRDDNRIENLELWSKSHPTGQRVADKIAWAKEMIALYERDETVIGCTPGLLSFGC